MTTTKKPEKAPVRPQSNTASTASKPKSKPATTGPVGARPKSVKVNQSMTPQHEKGGRVKKVTENEAPPVTPQFRLVPIEDIHPPTYRVRRRINPEHVQQLLASFRSRAPGPEHAIEVETRPESGFTRHGGDHRLTAAKLAEHKHFWVRVQDGLSESDRVSHAVKENLGLPQSPLDLGHAARKYLSLTSETGAQKRLAQEWGVGEQTLSDRIAADEVYEHSYGNEVYERPYHDGEDKPSDVTEADPLTYWEKHANVLTLISRKPPETWKSLVSQCLAQKCSETEAKALIDQVESSKPRKKATKVAQEAPDKSVQAEAPAAPPKALHAPVLRDGEQAHEAPAEPSQAGGGAAGTGSATSGEDGQAVLDHGQVERGHGQERLPVRVQVTSMTEPTAVHGQDPAGAAPPSSAPADDLAGPVQECLRAIAVLSQRTGLAEEVVVEAVRRAVLGGGPGRVSDIVLDLKTAPEAT